MMWEVEVEFEVEVERFFDFGRNDSFIGELRGQRLEPQTLDLVQEGVLCVDSRDFGLSPE